MIYPSARAVLVCAAGAAVSLALAAVRPELWLIGAGWIGMTVSLLLADAGLAARRRGVEATVDAPGTLGLGREAAVSFALGFQGRSPPRVEAALEVNARLQLDAERVTTAIAAAGGQARFLVRAERRGEGRLERLWVRWCGPLGLVWKQRSWALDHTILVTLDLQGVTEQAARLFSRTNAFGSKVELETGAGSEFHALREFTTGMDRRAVDWKQSARHGELLAKEFRTERNHPLVLALDAGRAMSEPLGGMPRIDRAINAALLLAYAGLKMGDRVALSSFDSRPRISSGAVSGTPAYRLLQQLAARIDYSSEETNHTLGLTRLGADLERRSLVVVFTEFADTVSAELMIENLGRLMQRHLVLFVAFRDEELEQLAAAAPESAEDISRAVVAASLLRERDGVLRRLRRLGAEIVEAPADHMGPALLNGYLDIKRRERL